MREQQDPTPSAAVFEARLAEAAGAVEARLESLIGTGTADGTPDRLTQAMRHAALGGGKRFRAFLVMECAALAGGDRDAALEVAAALECVHAYSLVHDDLPAMDNDEVRRGQPTVWKAFDEWTAILAGDALLTLAFEAIARLPQTVSAQAKLTIIGKLARDAGRAGMVGGQVLDLEAEKLGHPVKPTIEHISRLQAMKTGALITFACEAGAHLGTLAPEQHRAILAYSRALGLAFQISDDLLDAEGDAAIVGKAVGKDNALNKATLVGHMGVAAARAKLAAVVAEARQALAPFGERANVLAAAAQFMIARRK